MDAKQMKEKACRLIEPELERILNLPALDSTSLNQLHILSDTKKNFMKMESLENQNMGMMNGGNSFGYNSYAPGYVMGNSYAQGQGGNSNAYMPGFSYGQGGNSNGMYQSYDNGFSRNDTYAHLEAAMREARNDQEREEIRQLMSRYHN